MNELLSIAIPTYNRNRYLSSLLLSINEQYATELGDLIHIYVFDNGSKHDTERLLEKLDLRFSHTYFHHGHNIGGKNNVHYAYTNCQGEYLWVIGDDEILPNGSLEEVIGLIRKYSPGLMITRGSLHDPFVQSKECYKNYAELAVDCLENSPYFLIAHSLISSNIIKRNCFDTDFAKEKIASAYSHFFGIINGVIEKNAPVVYTKKLTLIVRSKRARMKFDKEDTPETIPLEQNRYLNWLFKKLKRYNADLNDRLTESQMNLTQTWNIYLPKRDQNAELQTIQSILVDAKLRKLNSNKDTRHQELQNSEMRSFQSICQEYDNKSFSFMDENHDIPISLLVTVYNEEERIGSVLASGIKWADEIVVINKSSTDRTKEICLQFGEKVKVVDMPFSHQGDGNMVSYAKIPTHDWIFFSTASEIPTRKLIGRIKRILRDSEGNFDLMYVPRKYYSFGIHDKRSPWSVSYFPFMVNRKKAIIRDIIHHNFTPSNPNNVAKIEYADDCCVYHLTHPTASGYLQAMRDYFVAEAEECENPSAKIQQCMENIAKYEAPLRSGGDDLLGHYFAWGIYWLGTALSVWEKWRGIDVKQYYNQIRQNVIAREWVEDPTVTVLSPKIQAAVQNNTPHEAPLVTAIVSTYNSERFIRGCMEDLEAQTIRDFLEIIVIDSGSEQNEGEVIKQFQNRYSNIKYLKTDQRETVYAAWNRGIKLATGRYITSANTDDRHTPYAFERMVHVLEKNPDIALVYANGWMTENENETFENFTPAGRYCWKDFDRNTLIDGCYIGPQPMWRRNIHEEYGYFDEEFHFAGDWDFWLRISETKKFLHLNEFLGLCLKSRASIGHRDPEQTRNEVKRVRERHNSQKAEPTSEPNENIEELYQHIQNLLTHGANKEASEGLKRLLDLYPDCAIAHNDLGVLCFQEGRKEETLKHYRKAAELEPGNMNFQKNLADFYWFEMDRIEDAMRLYINVLNVFPEDIEALVAIGHICIALKKFDDAEAFFNRALHADPENKDALQYLEHLQRLRA